MKTSLRLFITLFAGVLPVATFANSGTQVEYLQQTFVSELANNIDAKFDQVANSATSLGRTYIKSYQTLGGSLGSGSSLYVGQYVKHHSNQDSSLSHGAFSQQLRQGLRQIDFSNTPKGSVSYRSPVLSSYIYSDDSITPLLRKQVSTIAKMQPAFSALYTTLNDGWVYLTTSDNVMAIYPYVPFDEALANKNPTQTPFYQAANFKDRKLGWSDPYMDLVGGGLMVTASYPMYSKGHLLGVASVDVTINHLLRTFKDIRSFDLGRFLIVSDKGMKIADLGSHIAESINKPIYYRSAKALFNANLDGQPSSEPSMNSTIESLLSYVRENPQQREWHFTLSKDQQRHTLNAVKLTSTGWILVNII
ncbi:cache domain-containing protein [Vibrio sp. S4M6]|uniref:cache domain-containing protein n=1 Tax=Vibrio sinus TaxID=2946865 RepID=UPI002029FFE0|nr:cache domain-containing protein [Vibrio sinus]MCL9781752.1 cache domain-containing protein [Vibrio sinus]